MRIWGSIEEPRKIEFISYSPEYRDQVLSVLKEGYFPYETVSVGYEISKNVEAQKELEPLYTDVLEKNLSIIAKDVESNKIVGVVLNLILVNHFAWDWI